MLVKKRRNSIDLLFKAIHPKQVDCVMKFDVGRAAEYNKSSTLQFFAITNRQRFGRQRKKCSFYRSVSKNVTMTKVNGRTQILPETKDATSIGATWALIHSMAGEFLIVIPHRTASGIYLRFAKKTRYPNDSANYI